MAADKQLKFLNVPVCELPKVFDFPEFEKQVLEFWEVSGIFQKLKEFNHESESKFRFIDGPITANNPMGIHHVLGRSLKDAFQRYHSMLCESQRYQNGHDCQGLWVEVEVEKALGLNSKQEIRDYSITKFSEACRKRVDKFSAIQQEQSRRLGQFMDWDNSYYTMDDNNIEHIWHFLTVVNNNNWLYKGHRVMPWCPRCATSLSTHEMADSYSTLVHDSVYLRLPLKKEDNHYFLVWTTTPWTLTSNVALAVNPVMEYAVVKQDGAVYYLAKTLLPVLDGEYELLDTVTGENLVGIEYEGPFDDIPLQKGTRHGVIPWQEVSDGEGTGIVHIAPGCGAEDHELGKEYGLAALSPINGAGVLLDTCGPELGGLRANSASQAVFSSLLSKGLLYRVEPYEHQYPTCWRCDEELLFRLTSEWFISTDGIRHDLLEASRTVKWIPASSGKRMEEWLLNMGDWCISRKRFWGLPLPFYECDCGEMTVVHSKKHLRELAVDKQKVDGLKELHRPWIDNVEIKCPACGKTVTRIPEVGDCWLDAGIVPFSTLNYLTDREYWREWFPADLIIEMVEQVRLWFYSLLFMSVTLEGKAPYRTVMTHGKVRDERGEIFHKTSPNFIPFDRAVEEMGSDPIRWLMFSKDLTKDLNFVNEEVHSAKKRMGPFWNALLFFLSNAEVDKLSTDQLVSTKINDPLDEWIITRLDQLSLNLREKFDSCSTKHFTRRTEEFLDDLTNWWLKLNRHRFWKHDLDNHKLAAYTVLFRCLKGVAVLTAPVMPYFSEVVHQLLTRKYDIKAPISIHMMPYPEKKDLDTRVTGLFTEFKAVVNLGLKARALEGLRLRQPLQSVKVATVNQPVENLWKFDEPLKRALNVKHIDYVVDPKTMTKYVIKPNFKKLGPKYGKLINQISDSLDSLDDVSSVLAGNGIVVRVFKEGSNQITRLELSPDEVEVVTGQEEGYHSLSSNGVSVSLDTELTEDLRKEGFARDFVRHVQNARKQTGLDISDWIVLKVKGNIDVMTSLGDFKHYIQKETLAREMVLESIDTAKIEDDEQSWGLQLDGHLVNFVITTC